MIGLSEPVASLQFPHLATSRGCAEWFRKEKISSEQQRFSGQQCFAEARGQRRKGGRLLLLLRRSHGWAVHSMSGRECSTDWANWGPTLPC